MDMMTGTLREGGSIYCWRCNPQIKVHGSEVGPKKKELQCIAQSSDKISHAQVQTEHALL